MPIKYKGIDIEITLNPNMLNQPQYSFRVFVRDETLFESEPSYRTYEMAYAAATAKINEIWEARQQWIG